MKFYRQFALVFAGLLSGSMYSEAQSIKVAGRNYQVERNQPAAFDEAELRKKMKDDGLSQPMIDKLIEQRKLLFIKGKDVEWTQLKQEKPPVTNAACSDLGGENGWSAWQGDVGTANSGGQTWTPPPGVPAAPNFSLTTGAGVDPCTPGPNAGSPPIPVVAPGFGNSSLLIGQQQTTGCVAEQLTFPLTVTANDTNFVYTYAIVVQDAGHSAADQPFVELCIYDSNGQPINCGCFRYTGGPNLPGFFPANCSFGTYYKPWTTVGVNLTQYIGQTLNVVITNVDCSACGHFAHSYWDFSCGVLSTNPASYCIGQQVSITAPSDPQIAYTYQWYQNGQPYTGAPSGTAQTITPFPQPGDTFVVSVMQPSGCNFTVVYVPQPMSINPDFLFAGTCGTINFTDQSTAPNGVPITGWNWTFPSGTPSTSTAQNPTVTFPPGTYSVTLIATAQTGCIDTIIKVVTVGGFPTATFTVNPVCEGNPTQFTDQSSASPGDPIANWSWTFTGGNPASSTTQNPVVTYPPGNYTASLTVTSQQGCTASVSQPVVVNPRPVANHSGNNVCFNNLTTLNDLSTGNNTVSNWDWSFGDGNVSTAQNPTHTYGNPGTYTVTLITTNNFGCKDTNAIAVVVHPLPVANYTYTPVCFGDTTCFNDLSTITQGNVTGWSWNFGDPNSASNISNLQNPCHVFSGNGPYTVILTVTSDSGCQSTTQLQALVNPLPLADITPQSVCFGYPVSLNDGSMPAAGDPISAWDWDFGDGTPHATVQNPSHTYASGNTFTVTLIVTSTKGCKDTTSVPLTIYNSPIAAFTTPDSGCAPVTHSFNDISTSQDGNIVAWQWSFPGGSPIASVSQNPTNIVWNTPGVYDVQLIVTTQYGCKDTLLIPQYIHVYAWPTADFCVAPMQASINDPQFSFCDLWSSDVTSWTWNFGDNTPLDSVNTDPTHTYTTIVTNNDFYSVPICVYVENIHGCFDTICKTVELIPEFEFYIPNCFTPNGDAINDFFFGKSRGVKEYNIWVFDRWGNLIWDCHYEGKNTDWDSQGKDGMSAACQWDSKVEGGGSNQQVQEDVYVWKVKLTDIFDKHHTYIGHVSVVK